MLLTDKRHRTGMIIAIVAMSVIVVASNYLVQFPINDWVTYGAFTYPVCFLVTDLTNRTFGAARARIVVMVGFAVAVVLSIVFATPRIAAASGTAFLLAQLTDVFIFDKLRQGSWWRAPLISSSVASALDTALFFALAFAGLGLPWVTWAIGDFAVKMAVALAMLVPFRLLMSSTKPLTTP